MKPRPHILATRQRWKRSAIALAALMAAVPGVCAPASAKVIKLKLMPGVYQPQSVVAAQISAREPGAASAATGAAAPPRSATSAPKPGADSAEQPLPLTPRAAAAAARAARALADEAVGYDIGAVPVSAANKRGAAAATCIAGC